MAALTELSLFSGAGGGLLATKHLLGWRTVCYVEWDKYAIDVLKARIRDGYLDDAPIWDDAFSFDGRPWAGLVDIVTAGFPCQPFSSAGKGLAENDPRNGWPAVIRILREVRPRYALLENVPGLISKPYFRRILGELAEAGFDIEQDCISAQEKGAPHKRERLWIVAHANGSGHLRDYSDESEEGCQLRNIALGVISAGGTPSQFTNPNSSRLPQLTRAELGGISDQAGESARSFFSGGSATEERRNWWEVEPELGRVADGVANRVDRLRAIGNGQVPAVVREAWNRLTEHS